MITISISLSTGTEIGVGVGWAFRGKHTKMVSITVFSLKMEYNIEMRLKMDVCKNVFKISSKHGF